MEEASHVKCQTKLFLKFFRAPYVTQTVRSSLPRIAISETSKTPSTLGQKAIPLLERDSRDESFTESKCVCSALYVAPSFLSPRLLACIHETFDARASLSIDSKHSAIPVRVDHA